MLDKTKQWIKENPQRSKQIAVGIGAAAGLVVAAIVLKSVYDIDDALEFAEKVQEASITE